MTDALARLHEIAIELRCIAREAQASADRITAALAISESGIGLSDKSATIQGGDIDTDGEGFAPMRPDDADPESGLHP